MTPICPCCGYNLQRERPIEDGPFSYDPTIPAFMIDRERVPLPPQCREMVGAIMQAQGRTLKFDVLVDRVGADSGNAPGHVSAVLHFARKAFAAAPYGNPLECVRGVGMRWAGA